MTLEDFAEVVRGISEKDRKILIKLYQYRLDILAGHGTIRS